MCFVFRVSESLISGIIVGKFPKSPLIRGGENICNVKTINNNNLGSNLGFYFWILIGVARALGPEQWVVNTSGESQDFTTGVREGEKSEGRAHGNREGGTSSNKAKSFILPPPSSLSRMDSSSGEPHPAATHHQPSVRKEGGKPRLVSQAVNQLYDALPGGSV